MKVSDVCKSYFNGFKEISSKNSKKVRAIGAFKIFSYCTIVFPLIFGVTYAAASLYGRVSKTPVTPVVPAPLRPGATAGSAPVAAAVSTDSTSQPTVVSNGWGAIQLEFQGRRYDFKDAVILPDEAPQEWDWRWNPSNPMGHTKGIREEDLEHWILKGGTQKLDLIILSTGRGHKDESARDSGYLDNPGPGILNIQDDTYLTLRSVKIPYFIGKTAAAIAEYEQACKAGKRVAALIHTTC